MLLVIERGSEEIENRLIFFWGLEFGWECSSTIVNFINAQTSWVMKVRKTLNIISGSNERKLWYSFVNTWAGSDATVAYDSRQQWTRVCHQTRAGVLTVVNYFLTSFSFENENFHATRASSRVEFATRAWDDRLERSYVSVLFLLLSLILLLLFEFFRHRHVPKAVFKAAKEKKIMLASIKRKYVLIKNFSI